MLCIVSSVSRTGLVFETKAEVVQCEKKQQFQGQPITVLSHPPPCCEFEQLCSDYIHLNSIYLPVEWSREGDQGGAEVSQVKTTPRWATVSRAMSRDREKHMDRDTR